MSTKDSEVVGSIEESLGCYVSRDGAPYLPKRSFKKIELFVRIQIFDVR